MESPLKSKQYRISHLYKIVNKAKELVPFVPNRAQEHFLKVAHTRNIILKSRQLGFTTLETIDSLDDVLFNRNQDALIIANDLDSAEAIFDKKIQLAWDNFDPKLKAIIGVDKDQAKTLKFDFGDGTYSSIAVDNSGRSGTYSRVHITELGEVAKKFPQKAEEIISGTIPAVPKDGRVDIESTAQGSQGLFFEMFWSAWRAGEPTTPEQFKAHFYSWRWDADIDDIDDPVPLSKLPQEFQDYKRQHKLDEWEITYYYRKWLSLNKDWEMLRREYPTTPEEAFASIIEGVIWAEEIGRARSDGRFKTVPWERAIPVHTVWDLGIGANLAVGFYQRVQNETRLIDYWEGTESEGLPQAAGVVLRKPYTYGKHFFPHDVRTTDQSTGKDRVATLKSLGIREIHYVPELSVDDGINAGRLLWDHLWVNVPTCNLWVTGVSEYRWSRDVRKGVWLHTPYHDSASHKGDVHRYAALCEKMMSNDKAPVYKQGAYQPTSEYEGGSKRVG